MRDAIASNHLSDTARDISWPIGIGMWTGNLTARWFSVFSLMLLFACTSEKASLEDLNRPKVAWWYDINFQPKSEALHGIDVNTVDKRWRYAHGLEPRDLEGRISQDDLKQFMASSLAFNVSADLDGDKILEEFFVGVFETTDGNKGRFVVITKEGRVVQHFTEEGSAGFSALLQGQHEVRWYKCVECGEFESITWTGKSYAFE